jgi:hypothetical protein
MVRCFPTMSRRRRVTCAALLGAVLQFCASAAVAARVTVCRGLDGHVEIESALDGDCCPAGGLRRNPQEVRTTEACDGCVDTPLLRSGISTPGKGALIGLPPGSWRLAPVMLSPRAGWRAPLAAPGAHRPRSSIVLLI